jgi:hypothetical protein
MYIKEPFGIRKDGVRLFINIDALIDENGEVVRDKDGHPVPRGFKIMQNETQTMYDEAIDVENAPYTYSETDIPIEESEEVVE